MIIVVNGGEKLIGLSVSLFVKSHVHKAGMRKFRIDQDFLIEHWHKIYVMSVVFAEIYV